MLIRVLGSAAGGGFPQWNCGCANCRGVRAGESAVTARTQESVAVSADGAQWFLLNCSPEIRQQIESFPPLHPRGPRHSPIAAILLTNGDLDHCLGLLSLRESHPLVVYATDACAAGSPTATCCTGRSIGFPARSRGGRSSSAARRNWPTSRGVASGLLVEAVAMPGKLPIHLEAGGTSDPEDSVGFRIRERATGRTLAYLSGVGAVTDAVPRAARGRRLRVLRRDLLVERRASRARARDEARRGHGPPAGRAVRTGAWPGCTG